MPPDSTEALQALSELPGDVAALAGQLTHGSRVLQNASVDQWFPRAAGPLGQSYAMRSARMAWDLSFAQRTGTSIFGFTFGRRTWVPLETKLSMQVAPVLRASVPAALPILVESPDYLVPSPTPSDLATHAPSGATAANSLLVRLEDGILGVLVPSDFRKTRLKYAGLEWPRSSRYPLAPMLAVIDALVDWRDRGMPANPAGAAGLPPSPNPGQVRQVIDVLSDAYLHCRRQLAADSRPWAVSAYDTTAIIRLDEDGALASKPKRERFLLTLNAHTEGRREPVLRLSAANSDVATDPLVQSMLDDIRYAPGKIERFARGLDVHWAIAQAFLDSSRGTARAVLLDRDGSNTDVLLILRGLLIGTQTLFVARMPFRLHGNGDRPRAEFLHEEGYDCIKLPLSELTQTTLKQSAAEWFLSVFANLRRWQELLR